MREVRWLCTITVATALIVVASLCHLSCLYGDAQARVADQGSWCERTGPHPSGLAMWSDDGEHWHD